MALVLLNVSFSVKCMASFFLDSGVKGRIKDKGLLRAKGSPRPHRKEKCMKIHSKL